jgi:nucleoside-diphosphate-sugar epimerase
MRSRIVVLGAAGFLGQRVMEAARRAGHAVTGVTRPASGSRPGLVLADAADATALLRVADGADGVINAVSGSPRDIVRIADHLNALQRRDAIGRIVQVSSLSVYGQERGVMHEGIRPLPALGHRYAHAKCRAERLIGGEEPTASRSLIVRPGCLYGPGAPVWVDRLARLLRAQRLGWLGRRGEGACHLIHVDDLARMIGALPLREIGGPALAAETWIAGPARLAAARVTGQPQDCVTPSMRRLFGARARIVSIRAPLADPRSFRSFRDGSAEAADAFLRGVAARGRLRGVPAPRPVAA